MRKRALLVVHQRTSYPGRIGEWLMRKGVTIDVRCPCYGHTLPKDLSGYSLVAMFGGPMSANDEHLCGIRAEMEWLPRVLDSDRPFLGVCLGAQMMARTLGAAVGPHPEGLVEIGYSEVEPTKASDGLLTDRMHVYQWHSEGFELPRGADLIARGTGAFPNQMFRHDDRIFGIQFHPEVTLDMKEKWTTHAAHKLVLPGAQPREQHLGRHDRYDPPFAAWSDRFLSSLLAMTDENGRRVKGAPPPVESGFAPA